MDKNKKFQLLNLPTEFYQQRAVGDLISRLTMNSTIAELLVRKIGRNGVTVAVAREKRRICFE